MARSTWIDSRLDEVAETIEQHASRPQSAGNQINQSATALVAIPTQFATLIDAINAEGNADQKRRLQEYTADFQALKATVDAANNRAEVQAVRDLEV